MPDSDSALRLAMIAATALITGGILATGPDGAWLWPARLLLLGLLVWFLATTARRPLGPLWLSPLTLLAALTLIFYSLIPALLLAVRFDYLAGTVESNLVNFSGQPPDALVILFSALCLAGAAACGAFIAWRGPGTAAVTAGPAPTGLRLGLAGIAVAAAVVQILWSRPELPALVLQTVRPQLAHNIIDGMAPLQAIALMVLLVDAIDVGGTARIAMAGLLIAVTAGLEVASGIGKFPIYLVAIAALVWLVRSSVSRKAKVMAAAAALVFGITSLSVISQIRGTTPYTLTWSDPARLTAGLVHTLLSKLAQRQYETGSCLGNVIKQGRIEPANGSPFYFLEALVPRLAWAGKPNFSPFNAYASKYCDNPTVNPLHSASITLLGEPIQRAGHRGLAIALAVLVAGLAGLTVAGIRGGRLRLASLCALSPWLIDFDQNYSLYWANAGKMMLYMTPVILLAMVCGVRRQEPLPPAPGLTR